MSEDQIGRGVCLHQVMVSRRVGGAAHVAVELARAAVRRGWRGFTWVPGPGPASETVAREGLPHSVIPLDATDTNRLHRLLTCARLAASLARVSHPVVHVHNTWMFCLVRPALAVTRARTVVHLHSEPDREEIAWMLKRPPAHIVACARHIAERVRSEVRQQGLQTPVTAVPNAVDVDRFVPGDRLATRAGLGISAADRFVILILANLAPGKGQSTAIRALSALVRHGVPAECWIVGEDRTGRDDYLQELRALSVSLRVSDHVRFLGFRSDVRELLQAADAFVLPSSTEGLPLSVLEAMASGVPVVGSNIPGILEIIDDGKTGFIVPAEHVEGYADRLLALYHTQELRARLAKAAAERVRREHTWQTFEERMFAVYAHAASEPFVVGSP